MKFLVFSFAASALAAFAQSSTPPAAGPRMAGHSAHGSAFDTGPRQKPWAMEGIGRAAFPITTKNPEVQRWFNQGNALLHSFWFYEAERTKPTVPSTALTSATK